MCDIIFEKANNRRGKVNRTMSAYAEAALKRFVKKGAMRDFLEFRKINVPQSLFQ